MPKLLRLTFLSLSAWLVAAQVPPPRDTAYPGAIEIRVDLTDVQRRMVNVRESIPVKPGHLTLLYPQWIPGNHSPTGPISKLAGLVITANGKAIRWVRDRIDVFAFHVDVPAGVSKLELAYQFLAPIKRDEGRISISSQIADLAWNQVSLYPAGFYSRQIRYIPYVKLPAGWQFATALEVNSRSGDEVQFHETSFNTLIDSPLYAGKNFKRFDLSTDAENKVFLDVFADKPANLAATPEELQWLRNMVSQAALLYRSHHYDHYDFLFLLSDVVGGIGLEHHQSSEDGTRADFFTDWPAGAFGRDLLAHEYTHSWNGKFRRPADLWTPNFNVPMQDDLLWVYEGMTQYWGLVLTARSGMRTPEQTRDILALIAADFDIDPGRTWRPLVDTTNQPTMSLRSPVSWVSWQRPEDYYEEGMLIWLDADTKIREMSGGKKSLDDFARAFFGMENGSFKTKTYSLDDVVAALNATQSYDWASFLRTRVYELASQTPKDGITRGGYRLTYSDSEPDWFKKALRPDFPVFFSTSLGFAVMKDGGLSDVWWDSVAFKAGITSDMQITAVNGEAFTSEKLTNAIKEAEKGNAPIKLLVKRNDEFQTFDLDYHGGLRYPKLERVDGTPARLDDILAPLK